MGEGFDAVDAFGFGENEKLKNLRGENEEEWICKNEEEQTCKNEEEWICTLRVWTAPGWDGYLSLSELEDLLGTVANKDGKVRLTRVK